MGFFVDADGSGYVRYNTRDSPLRHIVEKVRATPSWGVVLGAGSSVHAPYRLPAGALVPIACS